MMKAEIILKYFPELTERQKEQFEALDALYHDWNAKINVISRKDIDQLYEHHVLHSLAIAKAIRFRPGTRILADSPASPWPSSSPTASSSSSTARARRSAWHRR